MMTNPQQQQQQGGRWLGGQNPLGIDALIPDENTAQQVVQEATRDQAIKEVHFRRELDGTTYVRIELRPEAVSQFKDKLTRLGETVQRSYQSTGFGSSQQQ